MPNRVDTDPNSAYLRVMSQAHSDTGGRRVNLPLVAAGLVFGVLLAAAGGLWVHYGTAVFFEIVRAGIAACF